jgi:hypothetical protein
MRPARWRRRRACRGSRRRTPARMTSSWLSVFSACGCAMISKCRSGRGRVDHQAWRHRTCLAGAKVAIAVGERAGRRHDGTIAHGGQPSQSRTQTEPKGCNVASIALWQRGDMNGEPDGRPFGPYYPVANMRRKEEVIAKPQRSGNVLVLQKDLRGTSDDDDPFIPRLIEPFTRGRCLTCRDDPLDFDVCRRQQRIEAFRLEPMRDVSEQTACCDH